MTNKCKAFLHTKGRPCNSSAIKAEAAGLLYISFSNKGTCAAILCLA